MCHSALLTAHTGHLVEQAVLQSVLTVCVTCRLVVLSDNLITDNQAVTRQYRLKGIADADLFHTTSTNLFELRWVMLQEHRLEHVTEHAVTEVTLEDHSLYLPLFGFLGEELKGLLFVTTSTASVHQVDVTVEGIQHAPASLILTATARVNDQNLTLIRTSVTGGCMEGVNLVTLHAHVRKLLVAVLTVRQPLVMHWGLVRL
ncbi:RND family efflux transporter MFP subunit protein [Klebsiella phage KN3-1]|uniref:RND family efflux transporter MFP subunit protein n=1 Tax=Klebsiella phage KN3-1 TaxID=2282630 RepID=A0A3S5IBH9_BPK31|nr:RND family efflux transporter MFP subunit protein [Klebsiella phage KN3-1]BBF66870.1 RND family efflux transporter MFP subunit protein [Klebsiella phage KN3-1]